MQQHKLKQSKEETKHEEETVLNEETKQFNCDVKRILSQSPRNTNHRISRQKLFTPESALSALPSIQIATMIPSESAQECTKRLRQTSRIKSQLERNRALISNTLKPEITSERPKVGKLDISLSDRADECGERMSKTRNTLQANSVTEKNRKQTVYSNQKDQRKKNDDLLKDQSKTYSQYSINLTNVYGVNTLATTSKQTLPLDPHTPSIALDPFQSRNCFFMSQNPKRTALKSWSRKPKNTRNGSINETFSTVSKDNEKANIGDGQRINLRSINPLRNDIARERMKVRERERMYEECLTYHQYFTQVRHSYDSDEKEDINLDTGLGVKGVRMN